MTLCVDFWMLPAWRAAGFKIEEPFSDYIWLGGSYVGKINVQFQVWQYMTPYCFRRRILSKKKQASAACIVNLYCTRKLQIAKSRSPGSPRSYLNLQSSIMNHSPRALFLWFSIKLPFYPATNQAPIKVKCRRKTSTILLATQTHSSMQDKASEVVALGGFNFVSHLSRLISKLKVISDKMWQVFLYSIREFETFSSTLRTLHEQCLGLWVSDCGMLCLGTISKHLPSIPIHHPPTGLENEAAER